MDSHAGPLTVQPSRIEELETDFAALAPQLPDGLERRALSIPHGMVQELWRIQGSSMMSPGRVGTTLEDQSICTSTLR